MPRAYSTDMRARVIARVQSGTSRREAAEHYEVSASTAVVSAMRRHKIPGSRTAVWRFFQRHKITFKKSVARSGAGARGRGPRPAALDERTGHV